MNTTAAQIEKLFQGLAFLQSALTEGEPPTVETRSSEVSAILTVNGSELRPPLSGDIKAA
jgi:hypothetical protein